MEQGSSHPLAQAIVREAQRRQLSIPLASGQRALAGSGIEAEVNGSRILICAASKAAPAEHEAQIQQLESAGQTVVLVMRGETLLGILALVIGVTIISGATDAPNAIASAVSTRCLTPGAALALAAVFNFVGLVGMTYISTAVAHTMFNMVDFSGNTHQALLALIAAMIGSIGWGVFCWFWGIPASKSHSLIAGVTGGAIALNGLAGVVLSEWCSSSTAWCSRWWAASSSAWRPPRSSSFSSPASTASAATKCAWCCRTSAPARCRSSSGGPGRQKFMSIGLLGIALAFGMETSGATDFPCGS